MATHTKKGEFISLAKFWKHLGECYNLGPEYCYWPLNDTSIGFIEKGKEFPEFTRSLRDKTIICNVF